MRILLSIFAVVASLLFAAKMQEELVFLAALNAGDLEQLTGRGTAPRSYFSSVLWKDYFNAELRRAPEWQPVVYERFARRAAAGWGMAAVVALWLGLTGVYRSIARFHRRTYPSRYDYEVG